ncbi:MAG: hypothetical protein LBT09_15475 [Planctomycetaceae bacterium]|jgi:Ca2+-binding EF-hand superfamily protein|nr:hypothetical protein [Planctomycetaceae bacterium]
MRTIISNLSSSRLFLFFFVFCFFTVTVAAQEFPRPGGNWGGGRMPRGGFGERGGERTGDNRPPDASQRPQFPRNERQGGFGSGNFGGVGSGGGGNFRGGGIEVDVQLRNNERNERNLQRLRDFDTNKNGVIEQNEMSDPQRRETINRIVTRLGGNTNQATVNINELAKRVAASNQGGNSPLSNLPSDPLVPYFGEKETPRETILNFGDREKTQNHTATKNDNTTQTNKNNDKLTQARTILTQFDSNHNGTLDKDKGEWNGLSVDGNKADVNKDGRISMDELVVVLGGSGAVSGSMPALVKVKPSIPYERLPAGMPDWFFERDIDQDAQLTMLEYANGVALNDAIAAEFLFLDKNNDGIATVAEIFQTLKQVDEAKQRKVDLERREKELKLGNINNKVLSTKITNTNSPATDANSTIAITTKDKIANDANPSWGTTGPANLPPPPPPMNTGAPYSGYPPPPNFPQPPNFPSPPNFSQPPNFQPTIPIAQLENVVEQPAPLSNWKPGSPTVAPTETPSNAPYATGTSNNNNSRSGMSRDSGRSGRDRRESWNRDRDRDNPSGERRNDSRRGR